MSENPYPNAPEVTPDTTALRHCLGNPDAVEVVRSRYQAAYDLLAPLAAACEVAIPLIEEIYRQNERAMVILARAIHPDTPLVGPLANLTGRFGMVRQWREGIEMFRSMTYTDIVMGNPVMFAAKLLCKGAVEGLPGMIRQFKHQVLAHVVAADGPDAVYLRAWASE